MITTQDPFPEIANFTFGAMSLGSDIPASMDSDQAVAREALRAPIWIHASPTYSRGFAFMTLRLAYDALDQRPRMIIKIRDANPQLLRFEVEDACRRLGLESLDVAQLVTMRSGPGGIADDLAQGGAVSREIAKLREEGLLKSAVLFLRPEDAGAAEKVWPTGIVQGFTFFWNVAQCSCATEDWAYIQTQQAPVLAIRSLAGGSLEAVEEAKREDYRQLLADSGAADWTELNLRYAAASPIVKTSIGGTSKLEHLRDYLKYAVTPRPLDAELVERIEELKKR
jgi:aryl-alcohol dehydrogenase-like predicted oxidoreductase